MKKPKSPAFSFYTADWNGSVRVRMMTLEERGAFITLLAAAWDEIGLPDDLAYIARLLDLNPKGVRFVRIWDRLRGAFFLEGNRWYNRRQEIERARQAEFSAKQAGRAKGRWDKGDAGGKPRHTRGNANGGNANRGMPPDPNPVPNPPNPPRKIDAGFGEGDATPVADVLSDALPPEARDAWRKMLSGEVPAPRREDLS